MNLTQAMNETRVLFSTGQAVMWSSGSGFGKSQGAVQLFNKIRDDGAARGESWGLGVIFAATQTPPDLIGYQFKGEREFPTIDPVSGERVMKPVTITDPSIPLWMLSTEGKPAFMYDRFFLIIDEYGQGEGDVKRGCAEILLNGGTAPWYLPPGSVRLALTNEGARYGVTKDFDFCIARRTKLEIHPDAETWLGWADKPYLHQGRQYQVMPAIKAWAAANPTVLFEKEPEQQGPWCNPRQLCAFDRYLQDKFAITGAQEVDGTGIEVGAGTIGMGATTSVASHLQFRLQLPSYGDVCTDPTGTEVPTRADLQMLMAYELAGYAKPQDLAALITYINRLPKDMGVTFISALLRRDYKGMINTAPMQAWINKNAALVSIIATLSN